jgi:hypothetical protein
MTTIGTAVPGQCGWRPEGFEYPRSSTPTAAARRHTASNELYERRYAHEPSILR